MKCAILGNGPSRIAYSPENKYDLVIGCNIPWTKVDFTIIMDPDVITAWSKNHDLIEVPICVGTAAWRHSDGIKFRWYILEKNLFKELYKVPIHYSSGHLAAKKAIELGCTQLDLYGMDSYFEETMETYTRQHVPDNPMNHIKKWRTVWDDMKASNPSVEFNFIRSNNDIPN